MTKAILFDADGVVLKRQGSFFSERFAEKYDVPTDKINSFFKNEFRQCQLDKADLKAELAKYLPEWKWQGSVEDFMSYWFEDDFHPDKEVLSEIERFRERGIKCYFASDQEKYRAAFLREKFKDQFDGYFFSYELGYSKGEPDFFKIVIEKLAFDPSEISYYDDDQKNVDCASSNGIKSFLFRKIEDIKSSS
jgi:putative hydrolase of the HAD superfamily